MKAGAALVDFKLQEILPAEDPMSIPFLRLMAATNDVRQLGKLIFQARMDLDRTAGLDSQLVGCEIGYLFRMLCGHLYEAGKAFRDLDSKCADQINRLLAGDEDGKSALEHLRQVYNNNSDQSFDKAILAPIRNLGAFHYKDLRFREALEAHQEMIGQVVLGEFAGMSRYVVTDGFVEQLVASVVGGGTERYRVTDGSTEEVVTKKVGGGVEKLAEKMRDASVLAISLGQAVDALLRALFTERKGAVIQLRGVEIEDFIGSRGARELLKVRGDETYRDLLRRWQAQQGEQ